MARPPLLRRALNFITGQTPEEPGGMHGPTPALQADPPVDPTTLSDEEARPELTGVRSLWDSSIASGLTPHALAGILREAVRGDTRSYLTLAEEMEERELHYFSVLGTRKRALSGIRPSIEAASIEDADGKVVKAVEQLLDNPHFPDVVEDLLDALGKGYSVVEIMWESRDGLWMPGAYRWRDPRYFTFDYISRSEVRLAVDGTIDGQPLRPGKYIVHVPKNKSGIPIRGGFARLAAWMFLFKNYSIKDWASFLDVYGMPLRLGKYHPSATPEERRKLLMAVMQIASDAGAIIPESMAIELLETKGSPNASPFETMARFCDEQLSKAIIGQTMTVENGGSMAQAKVHNLIRIDLLRSDARQLAVTVNRDLVAWFVRFNFGETTKAPRVEFPVAEPEDIVALSGALGVLVPVGLKVAADEVREKMGLSKPAPDAELLTPPAQPSPPNDKETRDPDADTAINAQRVRNHVAGCQCGGCRKLALNARQDDDEIDAIGADAAADWAPQMTPLVRQILDAADRATSFEDMQRELDALTGRLDTDELAQRLALAMMKARGFGIATNG